MTILFGTICVVKIFTPLVVQQTNNISNIDTERVAESLQSQIVALDSMIVHFQDPNASSQSVEQIINDNLRNWINVTSITHIFNNIMGGLGNILVALFSITFISFSFCVMINYFTIL